MRRRQHGVALLMVLWMVLLMSGLLAAYAMTARVEHIAGRTAAAQVVAQQAARAGLEYAVSRMGGSDPGRRWTPDGSGHDLTFGGAQVRVNVRDESGKVDLNASDRTLLSGLLAGTGMPRPQAERLAGAIIDWRDADTLVQVGGGAEDGDYRAAGLPYGAKDAPFESVEELRQVLGITAEAFDALSPYLTVHTGRALPDPAWADGPVLAASGQQAPATPPLGGGSGTYSIDSTAQLADGRGARLSVLLRVGGNGLPGSTYTPLRWRAGTR